MRAESLDVLALRELVKGVAIVQFLPRRGALDQLEDRFEHVGESLSKELGVDLAVAVEFGDDLDVLVVDDQHARIVHDLRLSQRSIDGRLDLLGEDRPQPSELGLGCGILLQFHRHVQRSRHTTSLCVRRNCVYTASHGESITTAAGPWTASLRDIAGHTCSAVASRSRHWATQHLLTTLKAEESNKGDPQQLR